MAPVALCRYFCRSCVGVFPPSRRPIPGVESAELRDLPAEEVESNQDPVNAWGRWRKMLMVALLFTISFLASIAYSVVASFFPIEATEKGSNLLFTAIIISVSPLCLAISSPIIGYYLPKLGLKWTLMSGHMLVGGTFFLMGFLVDMPSGTVFIVFAVLIRMIEGVGWAMTVATTFAFLPILYPSRVATLTGIIFAGVGLGYTVGPPIGNILVVAAGYGAPFWALGGFTSTLVPLTCFLTKETSASSKVLPIKTVFKLISSLRFSMIQIAFIAAHASLTFMDAALALYLLNEIGFNLVSIGLTFGVMSATYMLGTFMGGPLADRIGLRKFTIFGLFLDGGALILLGCNALIPISQIWTVVLTLTASSCGAALAEVAVYSDLLKQAQRSHPREDEESLISAVSGITAFCQTFGSFLGSLLGGFLTYFSDFPTAVLVFGEALTAHAMLVLGISLIDLKLNQ